MRNRFVRARRKKCTKHRCTSLLTLVAASARKARPAGQGHIDAARKSEKSKCQRLLRQALPRAQHQQQRLSPPELPPQRCPSTLSTSLSPSSSASSVAAGHGSGPGPKSSTGVAGWLQWVHVVWLWQRKHTELPHPRTLYVHVACNCAASRYVRMILLLLTRTSSCILTSDAAGSTAEQLRHRELSSVVGRWSSLRKSVPGVAAFWDALGVVLLCSAITVLGGPCREAYN